MKNTLFQIEEIKEKTNDTSWVNDKDLLLKRKKEIQSLFPKPKDFSKEIESNRGVHGSFNEHDIINKFLKEKSFTERCQYIFSIFQFFENNFSNYNIIPKVYKEEYKFVKDLVKNIISKNKEEKTNGEKELFYQMKYNPVKFDFAADDLKLRYIKNKIKNNEKLSYNEDKWYKNNKGEIYLNSITFKENYRNLKKGFKVNFKPLTLLVGEQGSGKSTILSLLRDNNKKVLTFDLTEETIKKGIKTFYFDTEKDNPRMKDLHHFSNMDGTSKGIGIGGKLLTHFKSHGEVLKYYTVDLLRKTEPSVIFIDEPESSLSLRNQYELIKSLNIAINNGAQVIVATHCLPLIESVDEVFDMESGKWLKSKEFIKKSRNFN